MRRLLCNFTYPALRAVMASFNIATESTIFVASDGGNKALEMEYLSNGAVLASTIKQLPSIEEQVVFEMAVLSRCYLFVGSPYSTLSANVRAYRESRGLERNWFGQDSIIDTNF